MHTRALVAVTLAIPCVALAEPKPRAGAGAKVIEGADGPIVRGALARGAVRDVARAHLDDLRACHAAALAKTPGVAGDVMVQFTVAPSGAVIAAVVQRSTVTPEIGDCFVAAVKRWTFPNSHKGIVIVSYPFTLRAVAGAGKTRARPPAADKPGDDTVEMPVLRSNGGSNVTKIFGGDPPPDEHPMPPLTAPQ